jgi:hypothetical protein
MNGQKRLLHEIFGIVLRPSDPKEPPSQISAQNLVRELEEFPVRSAVAVETAL